MPRGPRKITMLIFLFSLFVFLGVYIGVNLYQSYVTSREYTERVSRSALECGQYTFDVNNVAYDGINLEFDVENTVGKEFNVLVVEVNGDVRENNLGTFSAGDIRHITLENIQIKDKFMVYPAGCREHNVKEITI